MAVCWRLILIHKVIHWVGRVGLSVAEAVFNFIGKKLLDLFRVYVCIYGNFFSYILTQECEFSTVASRIPCQWAGFLGVGCSTY
jgi:hypothetical protein